MTTTKRVDLWPWANRGNPIEVYVTACLWELEAEHTTEIEPYLVPYDKSVLWLVHGLDDVRFTLSSRLQEAGYPARALSRQIRTPADLYHAFRDATGLCAWRRTLPEHDMVRALDRACAAAIREIGLPKIEHRTLCRTTRQFAALAADACRIVRTRHLAAAHYLSNYPITTGGDQGWLDHYGLEISEAAQRRRTRVRLENLKKSVSEL